MTMTQIRRTTQVYEVYIKASAQKVWDAITDPEWTTKYAYKGRRRSSRARRDVPRRSRQTRCGRSACLR